MLLSVRQIIVGAIAVVTAIGSFTGQSWLAMTGYKDPLAIQVLGLITVASLVVLVFLIIVLTVPLLRRIQLQFPVRLKPTAQVSAAKKQEGPPSPLWITFDKTDPVCVDKRMVTINARPRLQFILFRVLVHNRSDDTVEGVRVFLDLRGRPSLEEVPLRFMLDQSEDGAPSVQGFDMDPHTKRYVNVVYWDPENEKLRGLFVLMFAQPPNGRIPNTILTVDSHGIDLIARGRNVPPYPKQFNLHMDDYGIPRFERATFDLTRSDEDQ